MTPTILNPPKKTFTDDERKRIAVGWSKSGLGQSQYAAAHGIKPRTLRLWLNEHAPTLASPDEIRDTGRHVLDALRRAAALLEEALDQEGGADRPAVEHEPRLPEVRAVSTPTSVSQAISQAGRQELPKEKHTGRYMFDDE